MEETISVDRGSDWCDLQISSYCRQRHGGPRNCILLGEVSICRFCLYELNKQEFPEDYEGISRENCNCKCHETGNCEGHPWHCFKCGDITKIDVLYFTRQQKERHPK